MSRPEYSRQLVVLVADDNMKHTIQGVLQRPQSFGFGQLTYEIFTHHHRDPGCLNEGHHFLRPFVNRFQHALLIFDREGCGRENLSREEIEQEIEKQLAVSGWGDRASAIVIDPELENWIWSDSPEVESALGWKERQPKLRVWLEKNGYLKDNSIKPSPPKEALEKALYVVRKPRSSSIFLKVAKSVSLKRCQDPAFLKLKNLLVKWFKEENEN